MIDDYVHKLIENLPEGTVCEQRLDLVLDGGIFNGSYLVGALYFLKEMERRKHVCIERISGCSIGAVVAFLYCIDALDMMPTLYDIINGEFKRSFTLHSIKQLKSHLKERIPDNVCSLVNNKLFICYHDISRHKKTTKSTYKTSDELIDVIIRSCYIPLLIDTHVLYKNKYMDGINAFIFNKEQGKKILHMELLSYDKAFHALNVKNEKTNFHRILSGLLDIHCFFIKQSSTSMCSYVDQWNICHQCHYATKGLLERIIVYAMYAMQYIKQYIPNDISDHLLVKIVGKIIFDIFSVILETYCL